MRTILTHKYILFLSRLILGVVFIIASIEKITMPELFAVSIQAYQIAPVFIVNLMALVIPWMELLCGVFIVGGLLIRSSSIILSALLSLFVVSMVVTLIRGLKIDCGCFGTSHESMISWVKVIEDVGLFLLGMHISIFSEQNSMKQHFLESQEYM